ncbi:MAG TPA: adenylate/guanylate cyclase domain-containing protein [Polyangiaceae bacterium]
MAPTAFALPPNRVQATFCFVDLAGFTALTEAQGDDDAADVATRFAEMTRASLGVGDRLIKTIGDAVFVMSPSAASGIELIERLLMLTSSIEFPSLRAGLHFGEAVQRDGDVFGAAVNLAARVAAEAFAGEVICTQAIADAAKDQDIPIVELGPVPLKNVRQTIELFSLALMVGDNATPLDPVCRAPVDRRAAAGRLRFGHIEYWFCSLTCAAAFASNPSWHASGMQSRRP